LLGRPRLRETPVSLNIFDALIYLAAVVAVVTGFSAGFIRSVATIIAYVAAAPIAVATVPLLAPALAGKADAPWTQDSVLLVGVFLIAGLVLGKLLRLAIDEAFGPSVGILDRMVGALLGAVRVGLIAITLVLIFDQIIPADQQPVFLAGSQLRPLLSTVAQASLKSLPPDITRTIDQLKRERGI
jgi:membrane protein required for colicin V production